MKEYKRLEKQVYHFIATRTNNPNPSITELLDFWEHFDLTYHTNHFQALLTLGANEDKRFTEEGLADQTHVTSRTLLRYRDLYMRSYLSFCKHRGVDPLVPTE